MRTRIAIVVATLLVASSALFAWNATRKRTKEEKDVKSVILASVYSPSTTKFLSVSFVAKEDDYVFAHVVADITNRFGVPLRKSLCVIYLVGATHVHWSTNRGISECDNPPTSDEINELKRANEWPGMPPYAGPPAESPDMRQ
jgi:hypothetical protein